MIDRDPDEIYETTGPLIDAQWSGRCAVNRDHRIKRGDTVSKIQYKDNPILPVSGVACKSCTKIIKGYR
jgi:hypothetical protein